MRLTYLLLFSVLVSNAPADDWRQFRGDSAGTVEQIKHPLTWDSKTNVAWAINVEGSGWSSPVVVGDRIFLTAAISENASKPKGMMAGVASMGSFRGAKPVKHRFVVSCRSIEDGKLIWQKDVCEKVPAVIHPSNTYATESPATDGKHLFTFFATTGSLVAWDLEGKELWRKELGSFKTGNGFGTGSSLVVHQQNVFVQYDNDSQSFVAAFNTSTGNQVWRNDRPTKTSWSTPLIWTGGTEPELVTCGSGVVTSYKPADGSVLWQLNGIQSSFSASPAVDAGQIYFGNSGPMSAGPLVAVKSDTRGTVNLDAKFKSDKIAWSRVRSGPGMASPVSMDGLLYIPGSSGILNCYDTTNGERVYQTRVPNMKTVAASLWADSNHLFILDENGTTHVIQPGREFKVLETNKIDDLFWSTPAVAGKTLLLRGVEKLYCIRQ